MDKNERDLYKLLLILIIAIISIAGTSGKTVKGEELNENRNIEIVIKNVRNSVLVNDGRKKINRKIIYIQEEKKIGKNARIVILEGDKYIMVTNKALKEKSKNKIIYKLLISKINAEGEIEWQKIYGYKGMKKNECIKIKKVENNKYLLLGAVSKRFKCDDKKYMILVKIDDYGYIEWDKEWDVEKGEYGSLYGINVMNLNGKYVILGTNTRGIQYSNEKKHCYLIKLKENGDEIKKIDINFGKKKYTIINGDLNNKNSLSLWCEGWNKRLSRYSNNIFCSVIDIDKFKISKRIEIYLEKKFGTLFFGSIDNIIRINDGKIFVGDIYTDFATSGIYVLKLDENNNSKWMKIYWNGNNLCNYKGVLYRGGNEFIIYGNISYKLQDYGNEIFLMKFNINADEVESEYMQIFGIGNRWNEVRDMVINEKGELIGLFEWSNKENGKYESYISIEKITVK